MPDSTENNADLGGRAARISVSLKEAVLQELGEIAQAEGRSLSNLCARLIESALLHYRRPL